MAERYLHLDGMASAACISPTQLNEQSQEFQIYNPSGSTYLSVTMTTPNRKEQESYYVETSTDPRGHQKCFKLQTCGDGTYNILTVHEDGNENGFLYLSDSVQSGIFHHSNNVLKSSKIIDGKEDLYKFQFSENESQAGLYSIECCGKLLYAEKGANRYLLANVMDAEIPMEAWFMLNLRTHIVSKELTDDEQHIILSKEAKSDVISYENKGTKTENVRLSLRDGKFFNIMKDADHGLNCFPTNPIAVDPSCKVAIQLSASFTTYMKLKKVQVETEHGKTFTAHTEQNCFHNILEFKYLDQD